MSNKKSSNIERDRKRKDLVPLEVERRVGCTPQCFESFQQKPSTLGPRPQDQQ